MVKDDIVRRGRELLAVLVHLRHLLSLDGAVDGRAGKAQVQRYRLDAVLPQVMALYLSAAKETNT